MGVINRPSDEQRHGPVAEWDKTVAAEIIKASRVFDDLIATYHTMYDISPDKPEREHGKITEFDPDASEIYAQPRLVGG